MKKNLEDVHQRLQYFYNALTICECEKKNISEEIEKFLPEIAPELKEINEKKIKEISEKFEYILDDTKISKTFYSLGSNLNVVNFIKKIDLETLNAFIEYNNEYEEFDSKLLENLKKLFHRFQDIKNQNFWEQDDFCKFMVNEIKDNEKYQAYIYLYEISYYLKDLELLEIIVNDNILLNKIRMIKIVNDSEFYFEYDENNYEFKNNQRNFYKIYCKIEEDLKKNKYN